MKALLYAAGLLALTCSGCIHEQEEKDDTEVRQLYGELCAAYRSYTDSLATASDTVSRLRIADALSESLRKVYASHSPDLDQQLTQGQNDTLWMLASKYMKLRNERIGSLSAPGDTVASADSIAE